MILNIPIYLLVKIIPKDKDLSIIGSSLGNHFADNSKYFYIYFHTIKKEKKNRLIWITKNKEVYKQLSSYNLPVEYLYSFKGLYTTIRASKVFLSHQLDDISALLLGGKLIIQLWHGIPLKKIGYKGDWDSDNLVGKLKYFFYRLMPFYYYMSCDRLIIPSLKMKDNYKKAFSFTYNDEKSKNDILILGQPRNDIFELKYTFNDLLFPEISKLNEYKKNYKYIISWLPTQRKALGKTIVELMYESNLDLEKLNNYCKRNDILFIIKPHFLDLNLLTSQLNSYENLLVHSIADPYPLLNYTDILLTDYSSVYFDFLLTKKPIIFTPFDYEEYFSTVSFYQDYEEMTPGVKCYKWNEVIKNIGIIISNQDRFIKERESFVKKINFIKNSSELIYKKFIDN